MIEERERMEDKTFDLITKMYSEIMQRFDTVDKKLDEKADKADIVKLENDIIRMENELVPKVQALFDGHKQHTDQLERIENEVTKQEEIIMRRVK